MREQEGHQPQNSIEIEGQQFEVDKNGYVKFGDVARWLLDMQGQYASRFVGGNFGSGLRFEGEPSQYHFLKIHKDDIEEFIKRVREHQKDKQ